MTLSVYPEIGLGENRELLHYRPHQRTVSNKDLKVLITLPHVQHLPLILPLRSKSDNWKKKNSNTVLVITVTAIWGSCTYFLSLSSSGTRTALPSGESTGCWQLSNPHTPSTWVNVLFKPQSPCLYWWWWLVSGASTCLIKLFLWACWERKQGLWGWTCSPGGTNGSHFPFLKGRITMQKKVLNRGSKGQEAEILPARASLSNHSWPEGSQLYSVGSISCLNLVCH